MNIIIKMTNNCNFSCVYCSVGDFTKITTMDVATIRKVIDDIPELLEKTGESKVVFIWHGGEPLTLSKTYFRETFVYAKEKIGEERVEHRIQTNGYLIDEEWIQLFDEFEVSVGISLDGYEELHDANRKTLAGEGTFVKIMNNIGLMRDNGREVSVLMVVNSDVLIDAERLFDFLLSNNLNCKIHAIYPCGRAEKREDVRSVYAAYIALLKKLFVKQMQTDENISIEPVSNMVEAIVYEGKMSECSFAGTCGEHFMCVFEDGEVSFCGRGVGEVSASYGNVREKSLWQLFSSKNAESVKLRQKYLQESECKDCEYYRLCHGGCTFESFLANGKIWGRFPHCELWKDFIDYLFTEGMQLLKERLLKEKKRHMDKLVADKMLLEVLHDNEI